MTKAKLIEKWTAKRATAAGEASKLGTSLAVLRQKFKRLASNDLKEAGKVRAQALGVERKLLQVAARVVTIDAFLKDI